eukprot:6810354-Alexandrium_andersonii.AAC.1
MLGRCGLARSDFRTNMLVESVQHGYGAAMAPLWPTRPTGQGGLPSHRLTGAPQGRLKKGATLWARPRARRLFGGSAEAAPMSI